MTTKQALETINGAEIMSLNTPIRKLQSAVLALMNAAKRCMDYDKKFDNGRLVCLPCVVGDTVYGQFYGHGKDIHKCKVTRIKACQFKDGSLRYFLDVEFDIIDPYFNDGRLMRCGNQAVFGEDYGNWNRAYLTKKEAELAKMERDENE